MIFFWDKNTPKTIPQALRLVNPPIGIEIYLEHFPRSDEHPEGGDDRWLAHVGAQGWFVITHDWMLHTRDNERRAIEQHGIGVFYLWGAESPKWEVMRLFARTYDRIIARARNTARPFIYRVNQIGRFYSVPLR